MKLILKLFFAISFLACSEKKEIIQPNNKLLGFKSVFLSELGEPNYKKNEDGINKFEVRYIEDVIYVSTVREANACGIYYGDIQISKDTINLDFLLKSDEVCTSLAIYKLTYLIDNPKRKKWVVVN